MFSRAPRKSFRHRAGLRPWHSTARQEMPWRDVMIRVANCRVLKECLEPVTVIFHFQPRLVCQCASHRVLPLMIMPGIVQKLSAKVTRRYAPGNVKPAPTIGIALKKMGGSVKLSECKMFLDLRASRLVMWRFVRTLSILEHLGHAPNSGRKNSTCASRQDHGRGCPCTRRLTGLGKGPTAMRGSLCNSLIIELTICL